MNFLKKFKKILYVFLILAVIIVIYSTIIEPHLLAVKHEKLYLPNFSPEHNGLKIAVLSDIHYGRQFTGIKKLEKIVKKTNQENPDLVLLLGDLDSYTIFQSKTPPYEISKILSNLNPKYGTISILGNHDIVPDTAKLILEQAGIPVLEDNDIVIYINKYPLIIYGLKDMWHYYPKPQEIISPVYKGNPIIVMSHNPDLFPDVPDFTTLTLSGHLHGGQIKLPFLGGIFTPSIWGQRYNNGYVVENNKHIYITTGIGGSVPFRIGIIPEIVILELYSQKTYPDKIIENTPPLKGIHKSLNTIGVKIYLKVMNDIFHKPF